jgi:4-amino-4-deoxy-L-arabinose transferase-like glycosyltransferase
MENPGRKLRRGRAFFKSNDTNRGDSKAEGLAILSSRLLLFSILLFALTLRLHALLIVHSENDEIIYQTLAEKVTKNLSDYTLQGTSLLPQLPKGTYDQPLFLRPPLFVYLLALFSAFHAAALLPILSGLGVLWATFAIGKKLAFQENTALVACLVLSFCPILLFSSVRILIDGLLALLVSGTLLLFLTALEEEKKSLVIFSGVTFGLALLTKETAVLILPVLSYLWFRKGPVTGKVRFFLYFWIPALLICAPWFYYFHKVNGYFFAGSEISQENLEFPFVNMMVHRPWYFYFVHVALLSPIYVFGYFEIVERAKKKESLTEVVWVLSYFVPLTFYGLMGQGYQTRYILPAMPGLALLTASGLSRRGSRVAVIAILLLGYALWTGILNSVLAKPPDLYTPFEFIRESVN